MKNSVVDVLMYLFDSIMETPSISREQLTATALEDAGFDKHDINEAFDWLATLSDDAFQSTACQNHTGSRILNDLEQSCLDTDSQALLLFLERERLISVTTREIILQFVTFLDCGPITLQQFKRIVLMIAINQSEPNEAISWLQEVLCLDETESCH